MGIGEVLVSVVLGLVINECCDISPWGARRLVRWAARCRHHTNPDRADVRAEEWAALIDERPGKLFKLATALGMATAAVVHRARTRSVRARVSSAPSLLTARLRRRLAAAGLAACVAGLFSGAACVAVIGAVQSLDGSTEPWDAPGAGVSPTTLAVGAGLTGLVELLRPAVVPSGLAKVLTFGGTLIWNANDRWEFLAVVTLTLGIWLTMMIPDNFSVKSHALLATYSIIKYVLILYALEGSDTWLNIVVAFLALGLSIGFAGSLGVVCSKRVLPLAPSVSGGPTSTDAPSPGMSENRNA